MKKRVILLLVAVMVLCIPIVFADIFDPLDNLFEDVIPNEDLQDENVQDNIALWVFASFTIVFAIIYASTGQIPLFKEQKGARTMIAISFSIIGVIVPGVIGILSSFGWLMVVITLVVSIVWMSMTAWKDFGTGYAQAGTRSLTAKGDYEKAENEYKKAQHEKEKEEDAAEKEKAELTNESRMVERLRLIDRNFRHKVDDIREYLKEMKGKLKEVENNVRISPHSEAVQSEMKAVLNDLAKLGTTYPRMVYDEKDMDECLNKVKGSVLHEDELFHEAVTEDKIAHHLMAVVKNKFSNANLRGIHGPGWWNKVKKIMKDDHVFIKKIKAHLKDKHHIMQKVQNEVKEIRGLTKPINNELVALNNNLKGGKLNDSIASIDKLLGLLNDQYKRAKDLETEIVNYEADIKKIHVRIDGHVLQLRVDGKI